MKKILIIDDDNRNVFALSAVLRSRGYGFVSATVPNDGLQIIRKDPEIGIVLMDMMMPEMDGYSLIPLMRKETEAHIPVIAVTAQAMTGDREKCLAAGADDYLSKPIDIDKLIKVIQTHLK